MNGWCMRTVQVQNEGSGQRDRHVPSSALLHLEPLPWAVLPKLAATSAATPALHERGVEVALDASEAATTAHRHHAAHPYKKRHSRRGRKGRARVNNPRP